MSQVVWTDKMETRLRLDWEGGKSAKQCAKNIEITCGVFISRMAVIGKARRMGITTPNKRRGVIKTVLDKIIDRVKKYKTRRTRKPVTPSPKVIEQISVAELPSVPVSARTLMELQPGDCRWPCWDSASTDRFYCAAPRHEPYPYCARHCNMAYQPSSQLRRAGIA